MVALDIGFELYEYATGTVQWGNPYLTPRQKAGQALAVIGTDISLAGTLAYFAVPWPIAIPVAFGWAIIADPVLARVPGTKENYRENRSLHPLNWLYPYSLR